MRNALHWVDTGLALASDELFEKSAHDGHARRSTYENKAVDPPGPDVGVAKGFHDGFVAERDDRSDDTLELGPREVIFEANRSR